MSAVGKFAGSFVSIAASPVGGALVVLILVLAMALACNDDAAPKPTPSPSPSASPEATAPPVQTPIPLPAETPTAQVENPPAPTPSPSPVVCAAGSTGQFLAAQATSDFAMYCPTFLPGGLTLAELGFTPPGATPEMDAPAPGELNAAFVSADHETQVVLYQGHLGASFVASIVESTEDEGVLPEPVAYGDLAGTLYAPLTAISSVSLGTFVIVELPGGITHVLHTAEVGVATVRQIAAGMQSLSP
jgi:hypothetical protein